MKIQLTLPVIAILLLPLIGCGEKATETSDAGSAEANGGLTEEQLIKGIGPISEVTLGPIDEALYARGEEIFSTKCSACHKLDKRYVGPALGDVIERRAPEYIMNMMLNPEEMVKMHPEAKALLAQFMTPMPSQNLTQEDARALLEYLREQREEG